MKTPSGYSTLQIALHWAVAAFVGLQFLINDGMGRALHKVLNGAAIDWNFTVLSHVTIGVVLLVLMLWRFAVRMTRGTPAPEANFQGRVAHAVHFVLYVVVILASLTGGTALFLGIHLMGDIHALTTNLLIGLIGLHVAGAAWHHFKLRDQTLWRMIRPGAQQD